MADITMCLGIKCKGKETCYRYTAKPDIYAQSYADFHNMKKPDSLKCPEYVFDDRQERGDKNGKEKL